jgi:hypothetical protein
VSAHPRARRVLPYKSVAVERGAPVNSPQWEDTSQGVSTSLKRDYHQTQTGLPGRSLHSRGPNFSRCAREERVPKWGTGLGQMWPALAPRRRLFLGSLSRNPILQPCLAKRFSGGHQKSPSNCIAAEHRSSFFWVKPGPPQAVGTIKSARRGPSWRRPHRDESLVQEVPIVSGQLHATVQLYSYLHATRAIPHQSLALAIDVASLSHSRQITSGLWKPS